MKPDAIKSFNARFQFGFLSYSSFIICLLSGIALAFIYDAAKPDYSISLMLLLNKPGLFIRSLHYWSAQIFLITSVFHIIDHLLKKSENTVKSSTWLGLTVVIPFMIYAMFSGFLLKGDYDSVQAMNIIQSVLISIPYFGKSISDIFLGNGSSLQIVYINHILTSTLIIWLITIEHSKKIIPSAKSMIQILPVILLVSLFFIPSISNQVNAVTNGPWYFAGMQEIFHWLSFPEIVFYFFAIILIAFFILKYLKDKSSAILKSMFLGLLILYIFISVFALFFRGEDWKLISPWKENPNAISFLSAANLKSPDDSLYKKVIPIINGKIESCMYCHSGMTGLSKSHDISTIGCYSCHLGNPLLSDKVLAHSGMTLTPGNLNIVEKTCGVSGCHPGIAARVNNSLMTTMSGVVAVDKYVFAEQTNLDEHYNIDKIGISPSDSHLRGLCAGCHLSGIKYNPASVDELSRGGGCSACHLNYQDKALSDFKMLQTKNKSNPNYHPEININVSDKNCFGCHSRSGRISTNYEGWHETHYSEKQFESLEKSKYRLLQDGRVFEKQTDDVHHKAGMQCVDCHNSYEIMGDGTKYTHEENAVKIKCIDCHTSNPATITPDKMDDEFQRILKLRNKFDITQKYIVSKETHIPYLNTTLINTQINTELKTNGKQLISNPVSELCGSNINGHSRLDCQSCHTSWAPQCVGCHTQYDPNAKGFDNLTNKETNGAWIEKDRDYLAEFPSLGIMKYENNQEKVTTFVPGMVLTIDNNKNKIFRRLFAPAFSHTVQKNATTCKSCHNNPLALGYGRGDLKYSVPGGIWSFKPKYEINKYDQLPEDAWIGFLKNPKKNTTTRTNTRAFSVEEQKRILTVGACFSCHNEKEKKVLNSLKDIKNIKKIISKKCILPVW